MSISGSSWYKTILSIPFVWRVRRNHGLEHATLNLLAQSKPGRNMAGHSDVQGFWLLGDIPTEEVRSVIQEAAERLRAGEYNLAIHPNCGTNFVTAGTLAGLAAVAGMWGAGQRWRDKLDRFPLVVTLATLALMLAQPLGLFAQKHLTTSGEIGGLEVVEIIPTRRGRIKAHRVLTRG
jgi:hypothetical protein